jgi:nucleotide-binding universal stress UspA family protein
VYNRILVPAENREHQEPALTHARALAQHAEATVILAWLVPVVASGEQFFTQIQVEPGSSGARRRDQGEAYLAEAAKSFQSEGIDLVSKIVVTPQPPEQAIIDLAQEEEADLIVMATLPQSAVGRFLFGSVGDKVRRRSPIPVLFVNPSQAGEREM